MPLFGNNALKLDVNCKFTHILNSQPPDADAPKHLSPASSNQQTHTFGVAREHVLPGALSRASPLSISVLGT